MPGRAAWQDSWVIDPWRFVDADDDLVADFLAGTVETVLELGGWLHPGLTIVAREGHIRLQVDPDIAEGECAVVVPSAAYVPISRVLWSPSDEGLEVDGLIDELTPEQTELLILQVALHNSCGKIPALVDEHPALSRHLSDDMTEAVRAFRPSFRAAFPSAAELFWSNRVFRLPIAAGRPPEPVAVPIIDLFDHMCGGATAQSLDDAFVVNISRPSPSSECFLDYGQERDSIGMAVVYGFADASNPRAHSAPMTVDVPRVGIVEIKARGRSRSGELLAPIVSKTPHGFTISHLTFRADDPARPSRELLQASAWSPEQVDAVVRAVNERNRDLVGRLMNLTRKSVSIAAVTLLEAARAQDTTLLGLSPHNQG